MVFGIQDKILVGQTVLSAVRHRFDWHKCRNGVTCGLCRIYLAKLIFSRASKTARSLATSGLGLDFEINLFESEDNALSAMMSTLSLDVSTSSTAICGVTPRALIGVPLGEKNFDTVNLNPPLP